MKCFFFYLFSLTSDGAQATVLSIDKGSIMFFNGHEYVSKPILHKGSGSVFLVEDYYILIQDRRVIIGEIGKPRPRKYRIRKTNHTCK